MGWKEARANRKKVSLTPPNDEALIGRRVLNGLGLVERQLLPATRRIFGEADPDEGTWVLTRNLLYWAWAHATEMTWLHKELTVEAHTVNGEKDIIERLEYWNPDKGGPVPTFMTRIKGTKQSLTYSLWPCDVIGIRLTPSYKVFHTINYNLGYHVAVQDTAHFVKQFGPYDWSSVINDQAE